MGNCQAPEKKMQPLPKLMQRTILNLGGSQNKQSKRCESERGFVEKQVRGGRGKAGETVIGIKVTKICYVHI